MIRCDIIYKRFSFAYFFRINFRSRDTHLVYNVAYTKTDMETLELYRVIHLVHLQNFPKN